MARRKSLRSQLYRAARDLGNVQAARGGPTSYGKRVVRRKVYRTTNGISQRGAEGAWAVALKSHWLFARTTQPRLGSQELLCSFWTVPLLSSLVLIVNR